MVRSTRVLRPDWSRHNSTDVEGAAVVRVATPKVNCYGLSLTHTAVMPTTTTASRDEMPREVTEVHSQRPDVQL